MDEATLERRFTEQAADHLREHTFFPDLLSDIRAGRVFPAIRVDEIHFYCGGGRLCKFDGHRMWTHSKYLNLIPSVSIDGKAREMPLTAVPQVRYGALKQVVETYRDPESGSARREKELRIVGHLFSHFSIAKNGCSADQPRLLDIEIRFPTSTQKQKKNPSKNKNCDMIDGLFLLPQGTLVFVEVKHTSYGAARGSGRREPDVVNQLRSYNGQVTPSRANQIRQVYERVTEELGTLLQQRLPIPQRVYDRVPLLIVGESRETANEKDTWQKQIRKESGWDFREPLIGIDGRGGVENMKRSLDRFFHDLEQSGW